MRIITTMALMLLIRLVVAQEISGKWVAYHSDDQGNRSEISRIKIDEKGQTFDVCIDNEIIHATFTYVGDSIYIGDPKNPTDIKVSYVWFASDDIILCYEKGYPMYFLIRLEDDEPYCNLK